MKPIIAAALGLALLAAPAAAQKLTIGVLKLASSGPVFIAQDKGYFAAEGLQSELKFFDAAQPVSVAVVSGDIDVGITGLTAGFYNLAGKGAIKIIAAQSREEKGFPLNAYLVTPQAHARGMDGLTKLAGAKVAITQTGSTFHYSLGILAQKYGFDLKSLQLVPLQSIPNMVNAFKGGQVDMLVAPATVSLPLINSGEGKLLGWVGDETPWQLGAIFTAPRTIAERRPLLEKFVRAYQRAAGEFHDAFLTKDSTGKTVHKPEGDALIATIAKFIPQQPAQIRAGLPFVDPQARLLVKDLYNQVAWYQSQGLVDKAVDAKDIVDLSFVSGHFE